MLVSEREAAAIYARAATRWYGARARSIAPSTIRKLSRKGDLSGVEAWRLVHEELLVLESSRAALGRQPNLPICSDAARTKRIKSSPVRSCPWETCAARDLQNSGSAAPPARRRGCWIAPYCPTRSFWIGFSRGCGVTNT